MAAFKLIGVGALSAAALLATSAGAANLVVNGGFETGDFTGWTPDPVSYPIYIVTSPVESGQYAAQIAGYSFGPDTLTQGIADAAQPYLLKFGYYQDSSTPSGLTVTWDGARVFTQTPDTGTGGVYQDVTATVLGTGSDTLVFTAYNDPGFTYVDDISLGAVPEPETWALMLVGFAVLGGALRRRCSPSQSEGLCVTP